MKSFKSLNFKEKLWYIGILAIYPLILLYDYIGKYIKFFSIRKRQITASILTVCLMLTMVPLAAITAFAAVGSITNYGSMEGKWNGNITTNLINIPAIGSGTSFWTGTMMPAGWSSKGISGTDTNLDVYRTTALDGTTDTFAIRPVNGGGTLNGGDACLGGADETPVRGAGVSYTVKLDSKAQTLANEGVLTTTSKAEFYKQNLYYYELGITIVFYNSAGSELSAVGAVPTYSESSATNKITKEVDAEGVHCGWYQTTGAGDGYLSRYVSNVKVPAGTVYIRYWYANRGTGNDRKAVKNMQAYLITPHSTGHPNWTKYSGSKSETTVKDNSNIVLSGDTTFSGDFIIGDGTKACIVNLCLNGYTLDMQNQQIAVKSGAELHLCDCQGTGVLTSAKADGTIIVNDGGNLHFSSGNIKNTATADGSCINIKTGGSVKMSGGSITGNIYGVENRGTFTITDGTVKGDSRGLNNRGTTTISGGTVTGSAGIYNYADHTLNLNGGTVKGTSTYAINNNGTAYIYGSPSILGEKADLYVSNAIHAENAKGTTAYTGDALTINVGTPAVSKVVVNNVTDKNSTSFSVINEGYTLKTSGENLVLTLSHIHTGVTGEFKEWTAKSGNLTSGNYYLTESNTTALTDNITIPEGAVVNLCLNGKTLDLGENQIKNNGNLTICDCQSEHGKIISTYTSYGIIDNEGTLTVTSGELEGYICIGNSSDATLTISDTAKITGEMYGVDNEGTFTMTGGTVTTNYSVCSAIRNLYTGKVRIIGGELNSTYKGISGGGEINVTGGTVTGQYGIYSEATNSIITISGDDTRIIADHESISSKGTVNINGGTISTNNTSSSDYAVFVNGANATATITKGKIVTNNTGYSFGVYAVSGAKVIITPEKDSDVVFETGGYCLMAGSDSTITVDGGTFTAFKDTAVNVGYTCSGGVTLNGGVFETKAAGDNVIDASGVLNIMGGTYTSNGGKTLRIYADASSSSYKTKVTIIGNVSLPDGIVLGGKSIGKNYAGEYILDLSAYTGITITTTFDTRFMTLTDGALVAKGSANMLTLTNDGYSLFDGTGDNTGEIILHKHSFVTANNETHHWTECTCGEATERKEHYSDKEENKATYTKKPVCDECGKEYGAKLVDSVAPTGKIEIGTNHWEEFLNKVTFGLFFNKYQYIEITADDEKSGVESIQYYLSETAISFDDIKKSDIDWKTYSSRVKIEPNNEYFVYAKITDKAGNVTYIDTDGIVLDNIAPTFSVTVGNDTFDDDIGRYYFITGEKEQNYFVEDTLAGIQKVEYLDSAAEMSDEELENATGWQTLNNGDMLPYQSGTSYNRYYRAIDKSGNASYVYLGVVVCYTDYTGEGFTADYTYGSEADVSVDVELDDMQTLAYRYISLFDKLTIFDGTKNYTTADGYEFYELSGKQGFGIKFTDGELIENILENDNTVTSVTLNVKPLVTAGTDFYGDVPSALPIKINIKPTNGEVKITSDIGKTYDGTAVNAPTYEKLGNGTVTTEYKLKGADDSTYTTVAPKNAGEYTVRVSVAAAQPYKAASATRDFTIAKATFAVTVKQNGELTYNGRAQTATVETTPSGNDAEVSYKYGIAENTCNSSTVPAFTNADTYTVYYVASCPNFNDVKGSFEVKIGKKALTVTAKDNTITYGDAPSSNGVIYDGFVLSETATVLKGTLAFEYSYAQYDDIGDNLFTITPMGLEADNYEITFKEGKLTVNPLKLEFDWNTLSPEDLVYDGNAKKIGTTVKNKVTSGPYDVWVWLEYHGDTKNVTDEGFYAQAFSAAGEKAYNYYVDGNDKSPVYKITKATPETNFPTALNIDTGKKLSNIDLTGFDGYTWDAPDTAVEYGVHEYSMTFTPADTQNYKTVSKMVKVTGGDITAPTGEITLKDNKWNEFLNNITFGLFFKETQSIVITAADTESGVKEIAYYLATEELSIDDVKALDNSKWTVYADAFDVEPDNKYVVYARITDNAGNVIYINSDGIVLDSIKPVIAGVENGKDIYGDATFTVQEEYLDTVTLDGKPIEVVDGKYSVPADNKEHTIVVTDKTGNQVTYKLTVFKNYKVSFVVDGKEISLSEVGYGKDANLPEIPAKDGYTAAWDVDGKNITADTVITAVYEKIPESPKTLDTANIWLGTALLMLSGIAVFGVGFAKKRKEQEAE